MSHYLRILTEDGSVRVTETGDTRINETQLYVTESDGGAVAGGLADYSTVAVRSSCGGAVAGGSANYSTVAVRSAEGGAVCGGYAKVVFSYAAPKFKDWLVQRLTPAKRATPRWAELARALQTFWEALFDPAFQECYTMHSIYTADENGRRRIVADMGGYFEADLSGDALPAAVALRKLELAQKDTAIPIRNVIQRLGFGAVEWLPLWALPADGAYGTKFYHEKTGIPDGAYLTSRGVLSVDLSGLTNDTLDRIEALVRQVKPLHICYDGVVYGDTDYSISFGRIAENNDSRITEDGNRRVTEGA